MDEEAKREAGYRVRYGEDIGETLPADFLERVMELDAKAYGWHPEYVGSLENMVARHEANQNSFVFLMNGDELVAYINFFPVRERMWKRIVSPGGDAPMVMGPLTDEAGEVVHDDDGSEVIVEKIPDDDIGAKDVLSYEEAARQGLPCDLFILSIVVDKARDIKRTAAADLAEAWISYMNKLEDGDGGRYPGATIRSIAGVAVSEGGRSFLRSKMFRIVRECQDHSAAYSDENSVVYLIDDDYLRKLLKGEYYRKTYHDDVYLLLPFADHPDNPKSFLLMAEGLRGEDEVPLLPAYLEERLEACREYECQNEVKNELRRYYLGEYRFLHTLDDYLDEEDPEEEPTIIGEERMYLSLVAHPTTNMYAVMIFLPDCRYSTSQVLDQCSHGYLKIRDTAWSGEDRESDTCAGLPEDCAALLRRLYDQEMNAEARRKLRRVDPDAVERQLKADMAALSLSEGAYHYVHLFDFLRARYGLINCGVGTGKALSCMMDRPPEQEFLNILAGETYLSLYQTFHINNPGLREMAENNVAVYDYYEAYMSDQTIAFILDKDNMNRNDILDPADQDRIDEEARAAWEAAAPNRWDSDASEEAREAALADFVAAWRSTREGVMKRANLAATYVFIMELVLFQNTALAKMTDKVSRALAQEGDVSMEYITELYKEYGKTIHFWKTDNFKYSGTEKEARQIRIAFDNDSLREVYHEQQEFLSKIVELKSDATDRRSNVILGIVGTILALFQVEEPITELIAEFYRRWMTSGFYDRSFLEGFDYAAAATHTFYVLVVGGCILAIVVMNILSRKRRFYQYRKLLRSATDRGALASQREGGLDETA